MLFICLYGGCSVPVGVETTWEDADPEDADPDTAFGDGDQETLSSNDTVSSHPSNKPSILTLHAMVVSLDGQTCVFSSRRQRVRGDAEAEECGFELAKDLVEKGAGAILEKIGLNRGKIQDAGGA